MARNCGKFENRTQTWRIVVLLCALTGCHGYQEQRFAMEPQDQSAIVGSRVTLPCRVENKVGALQWTKDDFGLGTHRNLSGYERYTMIGSDEEGDYSLDIRDVALEDDGRYQCQVSSGLNGEPPIRSRYAQLTVLVAPQPPRIIQGAFIDATENQLVDIECVSEGGKPAAEITWVDGNQMVITQGVENRVENLPDEQRFRTRSVLRLVPSKEFHNQTLTCQAQNTADRAYRMATVHIEVKYAPKLDVSVMSGAVNGRVPEGTEARFLCEVDSNPPPQMYRWYLNNNLVVGDYAEEMIIFNVSRKHNKAAVKCEVSNSAGRSEASLTLNVTYPPSFRTRPQNIEATLGSTVTLSCDVDGQPQPEIRWLFHEPGKIGVKGKAPNLRVHVDEETAGRYICKASVDGYPEIETEATIFIKGPPQILSNRTQLGSEGESTRIECATRSVPEPDDVRWFFEGREISVIHDPDYATLEEKLGDGIVRSSLVIRSSESKHYGVYNCSVTNEYGNANVAITLKPIKTLPLFIILIGVSSGIILIAAFVVILVICNRRRRRNQARNEKPDVTVNTSDIYNKDSDGSSNISDVKLQIPQERYDMEYTNLDRSDMKPGLPLAGPVPMPIRDDMMPFRYSNDYSDPTYNDAYFKGANEQTGHLMESNYRRPWTLATLEELLRVPYRPFQREYALFLKNPAYVYDYPQGYAPPPHLRVQSPTETTTNRSQQDSLTRSIDTSSTLPLSNGNGSENNSLKRTNKPEDTDAMNNLGLPLAGEVPISGPQVYTQPGNKNQSGVDLRYAATYGNPYLRNSLEEQLLARNKQLENGTLAREIKNNVCNEKTTPATHV